MSQNEGFGRRRFLGAAAAAMGGFASFGADGIAAQMGSRPGGANDATYWKKIKAEIRRARRRSSTTIWR